jgi:protein involved in polysaccharide export with SLBB domain
MALRTHTIVALLLFAALPVAAQNAPSRGSEIVLRPGDAVRITVWRQPELSGEFAIAANGAVEHPLYQAVHVAHVPLSAVEERLKTYLAGWQADPRFTVTPLFRVAVGGEVQRPSLYAFPPDVTIAQSVATAGGVTDRGRLNRIRVLRRDGELTVDLTRTGLAGEEMTVRSGDQILVERRGMVTFRDYIAPAGSLAMAAVTLVSVLLR